jgi:hypothetical protein
MTMKERGRRIAAACRLAKSIERSKIGHPPSQPAPWPESTWEFLRNMRPIAGDDALDVVAVL